VFLLIELLASIVRLEFFIVSGLLQGEAGTALESSD
jgi:hypothetical protein